MKRTGKHNGINVRCCYQSGYLAHIIYMALQVSTGHLVYLNTFCFETIRQQVATDAARYDGHTKTFLNQKAGDIERYALSPATGKFLVKEGHMLFSHYFFKDK